VGWVFVGRFWRRLRRHYGVPPPPTTASRESVACLCRYFVISHAVRSQFCPSRLPSVYRIHYNTQYRHIASLQGSANGPYLTLRSTTTAAGNPLWPNNVLLAPLDCVGLPIKCNITAVRIEACSGAVVVQYQISPIMV
jgi:hypothetical protein